MSPDTRLRLFLAVLLFAVGVCVVLVMWLSRPVEDAASVTTDPVPTMPSPVVPVTTTTVPPTTTTVAPDAPAPPLQTQTEPVEAASSTSSDVEQVIREAFARFGPGVASQAVAVAWCESKHDPNATGRAGEVGVLQLHPKYQWRRAAVHGWSMDDLYDPAKNAVVAADIYQTNGWQPWSCRSVLR